MRAAAAPTSPLIMDDIALGPGCAIRRLTRFGVLRAEETFGPFDAPSRYNPCMASGGNGRVTCVPWGFAVLKYTARGLSNADAWPRRKRHRANRGARCFDLSIKGQVDDA